MKKKDIGKCWQRLKSSINYSLDFISTLWSSFIGARYRGLLCLAKMFLWNTAQIIKRYADIPKVLGGWGLLLFPVVICHERAKSYNLKGRIETLYPYLYIVSRHILSFFCLFVSHTFACLYHLFPICRSLRVMSWRHRGFTWKPQTSLTKRKRQWNWLVDFAYLSHSRAYGYKRATGASTH